MELLQQMLRCGGKLALYLQPCVLALLLIDRLTRVPRFVFRKLLHLVAFTCVTFMILVAESWQAASLTSCLVAVLVWPILALLERRSWYARLFVEKEPGEIKKSLLLLFFVIAAVTAVGWGLFDRRPDAVAAILMWGVGDAAAALVGIPYGRHKAPFADGKKSWEGTAAMAVSSFVCGLFVLGTPLRCLASSLIGAAAELLSPSEYDTVTVPTLVLLALLLL